ncbi:3-coathanger stack domain-containing protein [Hymenobacter cheonanensis]|uniref:3-coathanger stack domain-containing protein n=1 Tax=Hymenobacter sp. CA2-7 TaxID=3063993 RepID=UPI003510B010
MSAGQAVTTLRSNGPALVLNSQSITLVSGQQISLQEGFSMEQGATFEAVLGGNSCAVARTSQGNSGWTYTPTTDATPSTDSTATPSTQQVARQDQSASTVCPTPTSDQLTSTAAPDKDDGSPQQAVIVNSYGVEVRRISLRGGRATATVKDLPRGMYYLLTQSKDKVNTVRFAIER